MSEQDFVFVPNSTTIFPYSYPDDEMSGSGNGTQLLNSTTTTSDPNYIPPEYLQMSRETRTCVIAYSILFIIAATGNFSVFFSVLQQLRRTKSRISILILHLSIADLLVTFGVIPLEVIWRITVQWYGGNVLCKICKFFHAFGLYLSSMVLICISLDRYFAIIHPLRVTDARRRGKLMLCSAWATAAICSIPQVRFESWYAYGDSWIRYPG
jgi:gonadotropin-releasing hormone receptor